jgi:colanic acid/amylovoran biosynthesis glycosyltransferase
MKSIVFKTHEFPTVSETFITNTIVCSIKKGFNVNILVDKRNTISQSSQKSLLIEFNLLSKTLEHQQPIDKLKRKKEFLILVLNPALFYYYIKFCLVRKKVSLDYVFHLNFYKPFKKATVFHVHFLSSLTPLLELKKIGYLNSKLVVTFHGYDAHYLPPTKVLDKLLLDIGKYVDHITVNSQYIKNKLVNKGFSDEMIHIVPIGIDTTFFRNNNQRDFKNNRVVKLITVGRLIPLKGQEYGIKSVKHLIDLGYNVSYTIIGSGSELSHLIELVKNLELNKVVHFLNNKNQAKVKNELAVHDIFLMTSTHDNKGRREAFGVTSLEAQSMGLPVIGFKSGGFPETVINDYTGFIVSDRDVIGMAAKVIELIDNQSKLKQMSLNAVTHIKEKFDLSSTEFTSFY